MNQRGLDVYITGMGSFSPGEKIPFDRIDDYLGEITEAPPKLLKWIKKVQPTIKEMLGMEYLYYAIDPVTRKPTEDNVSMCVKSAQKALAMAGMKARDIELLIYAGSAMEQVVPPTSVLIQDKLNIPYCAEMAIHSNCTSIYKALQVGADLIANGRYQSALLLSSQLSSSFLTAEYFNQKILVRDQVILRWFLCDGAGAVVLTNKKNPKGVNLKVVDTYLESVGVGLGPDMYALYGGHRAQPLEAYANGWHHLTQNITSVAKTAPPLCKKGLDNLLAKTGLDIREVKYFLANIPTKHLMDLSIKALKKTYKLQNVNFYTKLSERGYQGAPAILIALDEFFKEYTLNQGDILLSMVTESSKWMQAGFILEYAD
ncbi:MAG: 3-oxoacyl-ACP synthase [bacterium]